MNQQLAAQGPGLLGGVSPYSITSWIYLVHSLISRVHVGPEVNYVGLASHCSEEK